MTSTPRRSGHLGRGDREGQGGRGRREDQVSCRVPRRLRQPDRDELVSGLPGVRRRVLRRQVERPTFNSAEGKASADFFVGAMKQNAPPGVVEFNSDQEGAAILGGDRRGDHPVLRQCAEVGRSDRRRKKSGKLDFGVVPKQVKAIAADRHLHRRACRSRRRNKANAIEFLKWYTSRRCRRSSPRPAPSRSQRAASRCPDPGNRLIPVALQAARRRRQPRPRTPDWAKVEELPRHSSSTRRCRQDPAAARRSSRGGTGDRLPDAGRLLQVSVKAPRQRPANACRGRG